MPMATATELHELREAWIRAPRGRRDVRAKALQAAMTKTLREELAPEAPACIAVADPIPPLPTETPAHQVPNEECCEPFWKKGQYA